MDNIDKTILQMLQKNARTSMKEISREVNLSLPAVSERHRKLERQGYIKGYTAILDLEKLDKHFCCFCLLILNKGNCNRDEEFISFIRNSTDIMECHCITGSYEYIMKIVTTSPKKLEEILVELRDRWGVVKSTTFTVLSAIKEQAGVEL